MGAIGAKFYIFYPVANKMNKTNSSCRSAKNMYQFYVLNICACGKVAVLEFQEIKLETVAIHRRYFRTPIREICADLSDSEQ